MFQKAAVIFGRNYITLYFLTAYIIFGSAFELRAQVTPEEEDVISVDTKLIDVPLTVTTADGKPVLGLDRGNFIVLEDGTQQQIDEFKSSAAPFEVALVLDTSGSTRADLLKIQRAAENFIRSLREGDRVAIVAFRSESGAALVDIITKFTADRAVLEAAIKQIKTSNGTPYYDAMLKTAEDLFSKDASDEFRGRRAIVALTDGVDSSSNFEFTDVRDEIEAKNLISYFIKIDTRDFFESELLGDCQTSLRFSEAQLRRYYKTFYPKSKIERHTEFCTLGDFERLEISKRLYELADSQMNTLAKNSGGAVFEAVDLSDARQAFAKVASEIGTQYSLGYYSSNEKRDGTFRRIKVQLKNVPKGAVVRAREGYTAQKD